MAKHSDLPAEKRQEAVLSLLRREEPMAAIVRRYGISETCLARWREDFLAGGKASLASGKKGDTRDREIVSLRGEVEERDRVIGELTIANRILKIPAGPKL